MTTEVMVDTDIFTGGFLCDIEEKEWSGFKKQLQSLYDSVGAERRIEWSNMEQNIELVIEMSGSGKLEVEYRLCPSSFQGPYLSGEFAADQSYLPLWIGSAG